LGEFGLRQTTAAFACARCKEALVGEEGIQYLTDAWRVTEARTVGAIAGWVHGMKDVRMDWPGPHDVPLFRADGEENGVETITNPQALMWALHQISPLPLSRSLWCKEPAGLRVVPREPSKAPVGSDPTCASERSARLLLRVMGDIEETKLLVDRIMRGHEQCRYAANHILNIHRDFADPELSHEQALCPIAQGHYHWCKHLGSFASLMQECYENAWIEPFEHDQPPMLPTALLSSFYAAVSAVVLFHALKRRADPGVTEYLETWRHVRDPWLLDRLFNRSRNQLTHIVELNDPAILAHARCDKGHALIHFLNVARRCYAGR